LIAKASFFTLSEYWCITYLTLYYFYSFPQISQSALFFLYSTYHFHIFFILIVYFITIRNLVSHFCFYFLMIIWNFWQIFCVLFKISLHLFIVFPWSSILRHSTILLVAVFIEKYIIFINITILIKKNIICVFFWRFSNYMFFCRLKLTFCLILLFLFFFIFLIFFYFFIFFCSLYKI